MNEFQPVEVRRPEVLRWLVIAACAGMAFLTMSIAQRAMSTSPMALLITIPMVALLVWFGWSLATAKATKVIFDGERIVDDSGTELCRLDEIVEVERGFALFKPSSGFAIKLKEEKPRGWSPGLWWRSGRRIGIGGATPGRAARNMADALVTVSAMGELQRQGKIPKMPRRG